MSKTIIGFGGKIFALTVEELASDAGLVKAADQEAFSIAVTDGLDAHLVQKDEEDNDITIYAELVSNDGIDSTISIQVNP
jgi:formaldehyde-activating enzyme involved in methanogenesis